LLSSPSGSRPFAFMVFFEENSSLLDRRQTLQWQTSATKAAKFSNSILPAPKRGYSTGTQFRRSANPSPINGLTLILRELILGRSSKIHIWIETPVICGNLNKLESSCTNESESNSVTRSWNFAVGGTSKNISLVCTSPMNKRGNIC